MSAIGFQLFPQCVLPIYDYVSNDKQVPFFFFVRFKFQTISLVFVFLLPADSYQKISLGITTLLSYSVFTLAVVQKLPETSEYLPYISIYIGFVLSVTSLSIIFTVWVLTLHYKNKQTVKRLPRHLKNFSSLAGGFLFVKEPNSNSLRNLKLAISEKYDSLLPISDVTSDLKSDIFRIPKCVRIY